MSESNQEPNDHWFFNNSEYFPWEIMGLDRPRAGELHSYLCKICSKYENNPDMKRFMSGSPHWGALVKAAESQDDYNEHLSSIHKYCLRFYDKRKSERRNVEHEVVGFLEGFQEFRADFLKKLLDLWLQDRLKLKPEMMRNIYKRSY